MIKKITFVGAILKVKDMEVYRINDSLTTEDIKKLIASDIKLELSDGAKERIVKSRKYLEEKLQKEEKPIYGINTGFGYFTGKLDKVSCLRHW